MPVPSTIADLNQTAASNYPLGTDTVGPSLDDYLRAGLSFTRQLFDGTPFVLGGVSGTDTITATCPIPFTAYVVGQRFWIVPSGPNATTGVTLNVNGIGAKAVTRNGSVPLAPGDLAGLAQLYYDGTQFQVVTGTPHRAALRNRLINGNFQINQRTVTGSVVLTAGQYGHDRWKAGAAGCTYTFAASGNDVVITISAGSLMQVIEDINVEGGVYAISNEGTAQARYAVNGGATSGAYAAATKAAPLVTTSATASQQVTVEFSTGTIHRAQCEPGTATTVFERRMATLELAMCQRYLPAFNAAGAGLNPVCTGGSTSANTGTYTYVFKVPPRVPPTGVTVSNPGHFYCYGPTAATFPCSSLGFGVASLEAATLAATSAGTFATSGQSSILFSQAAAAQLLFTGCEL